MKKTAITASLPAVKKEIEKLREEINRHDYKYYLENQPEISDEQYDRLMKRLIDLEKDHPDLITPDSPSQRVGGKPLKVFPQVKHRVPMLSMDNTYSAEELREFDERVRKNLSGEKTEYVVELKIDGLSICLVYKNGFLEYGSTRGDGVTGDEVTANLKTIHSIPLRLNAAPGIKIPALIEARGEVYMSRKAFIELNEGKEETGEVLFANPRNAAAGSLKLLDPNLVAERKLDIFVHGAGYFEGVEIKTQEEILNFFKKSDLKINPNFKKCANIEEVIDYCHKWENKRDGLDYEIDGMVVKINSLKQQAKLGATSKSPRWMIAYKYPARKAVTKIEDIIVGVGRTGALTPVAVLKPVTLSGSLVSRASLHNQDEIKRKDIRIGDMVLIEKAGEIIPQVVGVLKEKRTGREKKFSMPDKCPSCGAPSVKLGEEVALRCQNVSCPAQLKERIRHFACREAMDIEGLGEAIISQLVDKELLKDYGDIYRLKYEQIKNLERMGDKSASNLIEAVEKSKNNSLSRLIYALGIRHAGVHAAEILAETFYSIEKLKQAGIETLTSISGLGPVIAQSIIDFFKHSENKKVLDKLTAANLKMKEEKKEFPKTAIFGKTFVLTGVLKDYSRLQAGEIIKKLGGRVSSSVSRETDFVLAGDEPGSKYDKANNLGIKILNEDDFKKMVREYEK